MRTQPCTASASPCPGRPLRPTGGRSQLCRLPDRARHRDRALLACRVRGRALLPRHPDRHQCRVVSALQGHKVLVEGTVSDEPRICGGIVLKPVTTSTLPEMDPSCNQMIPASDEFTVPFAPRGPGPSNRGLAFAARPALPAARRPRPPRRGSRLRHLSRPTRSASSRSPTNSTRPSLPAVPRAAYSRRFSTRGRSKPGKSKSCPGYRGTVLLSDGKPFTEKDGIARQRAEQVGELLREVGVPAEKLNVRWINAPTRATGQEDFKQRRVTLLVQP